MSGCSFRRRRPCRCFFSFSPPRRTPRPHGDIRTLFLLGGVREGTSTANLRTKILDFRGFDSSRILMLRGRIPRPKGNFAESLSQGILVCRLLVCGLTVLRAPGPRVTSEALREAAHGQKSARKGIAQQLGVEMQEFLCKGAYALSSYALTCAALKLVW